MATIRTSDFLSTEVCFTDFLKSLDGGLHFLNCYCHFQSQIAENKAQTDPLPSAPKGGLSV